MSLYRRLNSPYWWVRFQLDGREVRLSSGTANRAAAKAFEQVAKQRAWAQVRLGERAAYLWRDAARRWLSEARKRSLGKDRVIIDWFNGQFDATTTVQDITREVIDELRLLKAAETSESTADRYMALLRAVLKKCADDWGTLDKAPKVPMFRPDQGEPRWLTPPQFAKLEAELPNHLRAAARFAVLTGLRMRAMLSLTWDRVDMDRGRAWIAGRDMKGKRSHGLPLAPDAVAVLRRLDEDRKAAGPCQPDTPVFIWHGVRIADCNTAAFQKAVGRAKVAPLRWHDLRHTWASWAVQEGATLQQVMELGGWKSLAMVMRYAHLAPDHLSEAASRVRLPGTKTGTLELPVEDVAQVLDFGGKGGTRTLDPGIMSAPDPGQQGSGGRLRGLKRA